MNQLLWLIILFPYAGLLLAVYGLAAVVRKLRYNRRRHE